MFEILCSSSKQSTTCDNPQSRLNRLGNGRTHRSNNPRAIRPHQPRLVLRLEHIRNPHHVVLRNPLRDTHHQPNLRLDRLLNPPRRNGRRQEDRTGIGARLFHRVRHALEHRLPEVLRAGFVGVGAADDMRAVLDCLLGVEGALAAGEALEYDLGVVADAQVSGGLRVALGCFEGEGGGGASGRDGAARFGEEGSAERPLEGMHHAGSAQ